MSGKPYTPVALVDDHNLVRKGLVNLVNSMPGYRVVLEAANGRELTQLLGSGPDPLLAIIDLSMPIMDGFATIRWLSQNRPNIRAIALTFDGSEQAIIRALREGAKGFLLKDVEPEDLHRALDSVRDNGYVESDLQLRTVTTHRAANEPPYERQRAKVLSAISERERDFIVLACAPEEYTYDQIAERMGVKPSTVEAHRKNVFDRFGIRSKAGLVIFAYRWALVHANPL